MPTNIHIEYKKTLSSAERIKSRKAIDILFTQGQKCSAFPYLIFYKMTRAAVPSILQFGITVSKKKFKRAVDRNRVKRLSREVYRQQKSILQSALPPALHLELFFVFVGTDIPEYTWLYKKMEAALLTIKAIVNENFDENT